MLIEIWSDVVCPWCAVGKARFEQALARFPHADQVEVRWRSFELDPDAPAERDGDYVGHLAAKYGGGREGAQAMIDRMTDVAAAEGLDFRFDVARPGRTFDAHRLLHLAADRGRQHDLAEVLFRATFTDGEPIGDLEALQRLAVAAGLDEVEVKEVLAGDGYAEAVRADQAQARAYGISGVPFFVLDRAVGVSGAQPADVLLHAMEQAWARTAPLDLIAGSTTRPTDAKATAGAHADPACVDGSCEA
jgi:predicted DsbA family dithiol-disulfide isomerase